MMLFCILLLSNASGVYATHNDEGNVASITLNGETTFYTGFETAWGDACQKSKTSSVKMTL